MGCTSSKRPPAADEDASNGSDDDTESAVVVQEPGAEGCGGRGAPSRAGYTVNYKLTYLLTYMHTICKLQTANTNTVPADVCPRSAAVGCRLLPTVTRQTEIGPHRSHRSSYSSLSLVHVLCYPLPSGTSQLPFFAAVQHVCRTLDLGAAV